jgi:rhodanese-related sulfurtransferase
MRTILIFLLLISNTVFAEIINIDNKKLKKLIKQGIPVIDVRTKKEWIKTGVISDTYLISMINEEGKYSLKDWYKQFSKIELKDDAVVLICAVGGRSSYIAKILQSTNKDIDIFNLEKGIKNWIAENNPTYKYK